MFYETGIFLLTVCGWFLPRLLSMSLVPAKLTAAIFPHSIQLISTLNRNTLAHSHSSLFIIHYFEFRALTVPVVPAFVPVRRPVFIRVRRAVRSYRSSIFRYGLIPNLQTLLTSKGRLTRYFLSAPIY